MSFIKSLSLILAIVVVLSVWECNSYKACKIIKPADNWDPNHYNNMDQKHHVIATSECQNCDKGDIAWDWLRGRTNPIKVCFKVHGVTPEGYFNIYANCEMVDPYVPNLNCELDFTKYETVVRMKGSITIFDTDMENYFVTHFCVFGKESIWYITSLKPTLDDSIKEKLIEKIVGMGFNSNEAVEGVSPVFIKNTTTVACIARKI